MSQDLEIYIHIPFCVKKCNYCDFLSFPADAGTHAEYAAQIINELTFDAAKCGEYTVSSVFIGGGTPSIISERLITGILSAIYKHYHVRRDAEITIECNPSSAMRHKFAEYRKAGINRLSMGLQSADNAELKMLGRSHTFEEFLKAYQSARMEGFDNINVDLINCFPMQSLKTWKKTLRNTLMLKVEHVSVYNLIVEEGTPFDEMRKKGLLIMPSEEVQTAIDDFTRECMANYGYHRYEFSNYAKPGHECRHNTGYWTGVPYIGAGIGAASCFNNTRWTNVHDIGRYLDVDFSKGPDTESLSEAEQPENTLRENVQELSREDMMEEYMYLGMRLIRGVSASGFYNRFGVLIEDVFGDALRKNMSAGLIIKEDDAYRLSERGIDVSNVVLSDFLLH